MRKKTILVVDDEPDQREIYRAVLRHAGYVVLEAANAIEGIRLAVEAAPDLILLDMALPMMDGWEAARVLKQNPATSYIPVCAISARVLPPEDAARITAAGFECYLLKPIEPRLVLNEVASRIGLPAEGNLNIAGGTG
jgi:CheY-like chemotaxis protein